MKKLTQLFKFLAPMMALLLMVSFSGINVSAVKASSDEKPQPQSVLLNPKIVTHRQSILIPRFLSVGTIRLIYALDMMPKRLLVLTIR